MNGDERQPIDPMDPDGDGGLSGKVIGCAIAVSNGLGVGFLEKVHENALVHELKKAGLICAQQERMVVQYDGVVVGDYLADIVVNRELIIELKVAREITNIHQAQLINYLKATGVRVGLILNFGQPKLGIRRLVY